MKNIATLKTVFLAAVGLINATIVPSFGGWSTSMKTMLLFMGIDYLTGWVVSAIFHNSTKTEDGRYNSSIGWKSAAEEAAYMNAAIAFCSSNQYFSIYGEDYLVGYGKGAPALEYWAAANPLKVIGQVYVGSEGLDAEYLETTGATVFPTKNGNYNQINFPEDFKLLVYSDAVLPTWYIGGNAPASLAYWMAANDCVEAAEADPVFGQVYAQSEDSDAWMTDYAGPISKVAVAEEAENSSELTERICSFLYAYTRYENAFAYSNGLYERTVYGDKCYKTIPDVNGHPREYMVYEPANMQANAPVMFVFPGNTQTDLNFMDATQWQDVADREGFLLVMVCEDYNTSTTVTFKDANEFHEKLAAQIKKDYAGRIDAGRFYANGQSMGGMTVQGFGSTNPEYFAAIATTSGCLMDVMSGDFSGRTFQIMPTYMIYGAGDNVNFSGSLWDDVDNQLDDWARYYTSANGVSLASVAEEDGVTVFTDKNQHRTQTTWTWNKNVDGVDVPMVQLGKNSARAHNCLPTEEAELYSYAKHFRAEYDAAGNVMARYYSPSAFASDDAVKFYDASVQAIVSTQGITDATKIGQKLKAVAIEYSGIVDPASLALDTYTIRALKDTNRDLAYAEIVAVYTNDAPEMRKDQTSVPGKYVIVETSDTDWVGTKTVPNYYYMLDGEEAVMSNGPIDVCPLIAQKKDVALADGTRVVPSKEKAATQKTINLKLDSFKTLRIASENAQLPAPYKNEIVIQYCLPKGYSADKQYPMVLAQCGGGLRLLESFNSDGTLALSNEGMNLCYDSQATSWVTAKEDGYIDEDVIVISVNYRNTDKLGDLKPFYNEADDINQAVRYMLANFSVDPARVYYSGNSFGGLVGYEAIAKCPELYAAFMPNNSLAIQRIDTSTPEGVENMMNILKPSLDAYINNRIAIRWNLGERDFMAPPTQGIYYYEYMKEQYQALGLTDEQIDEILVWNVYTEDIYLDNGILNEDGSVNFHLATKVTYEVYRGENMNWLLKQRRQDKVAEKLTQQITTMAGSTNKITKVYGNKAFNLQAKTTGDGQLTYKSSDTKVVKVDKSGKVTIKGTGKAVITITVAATENYKAATLKVTIKVVPKKAAIASTKVSKKTLTVKVQKDTKASGYQVQVSTNVNFAKKSTCLVTTAKNTKVTATVKNLKPGTYYVRTRAYKTVGSSKYYGACSAVKVVVVK